MSKEASILIGVLVLVVGGMIGVFVVAGGSGSGNQAASQSVASKFASYASGLGINGDAVKKAVEKNQYKAVIAQDTADGNTLGVNATPTIYIAGKAVEPPYTADHFKQLVDAAIASGETPAIPAAQIRDNSFKQGTGSVKVVEFGDFQCPACGRVYPQMEKLKADYADKITFVFRNFPLTQIHQNAQAAANAVESAGAQGKYWAMYNKLYQTQTEWENL